MARHLEVTSGYGKGDLLDGVSRGEYKWLPKISPPTELELCLNACLGSGMKPEELPLDHVVEKIHTSSALRGSSYGILCGVSDCEVARIVDGDNVYPDQRLFLAPKTCPFEEV